MSIFFSANEILEFAVRIEENGEKFYRHAVRMTEDDHTREIFNFLAREEKNHNRVFEDLISKKKVHKIVESYPGEYFAYLQAYVDNIIFTPKVFDKEIDRVKDTLSALDFGIQRELDSILYYHEIKRFVLESQHKLIHRIIDEERNHFSKLTELRKRYVCPTETNYRYLAKCKILAFLYSFSSKWLCTERLNLKRKKTIIPSNHNSFISVPYCMVHQLKIYKIFHTCETTDILSNPLT